MQKCQACLDVMLNAAIFYAKIHQFMMNSKLLKDVYKRQGLNDAVYFTLALSELAVYGICAGVVMTTQQNAVL